MAEADIEPRQSNIPLARIEAALCASYELESLALGFPTASTSAPIGFANEYVQKLFINRIKDLARVVMSVLDDDRKTEELRKIVGLD